MAVFFFRSSTDFFRKRQIFHGKDSMSPLHKATFICNAPNHTMWITDVIGDVCTDGGCRQ